MQTFYKPTQIETASEVTVACYGLAFKPDIDDLRESPAMAITQKIAEMHSGRVIAIEPNIELLPSKLSNVELLDLVNAQKEADIHIILVDHKEFKSGLEISGLIVDTKGIL